MTLLHVNDLEVSFFKEGKELKAVRGVSLSVKAGESVGIMGESGSGKTSLIQAITGLAKEAKIQGSAFFQNINLLENNQSVLGTEIGMVFQDPMTSLNPTMKIGKQIAEGMLYHLRISRDEARQRALLLLKKVKIGSPEEALEKYPHQMSGGQRQRVAIAIALACEPKLLIADEPTTALDIQTQKEILSLLQECKKESEMSLLVISHDFDVLQEICDQVVVFYSGKIIEVGPLKEVFTCPLHPYTQMILKAKPRMDHPKSQPLQVIEGVAPPLDSSFIGCPFFERCPHAMQPCLKEYPIDKTLSHSTSCRLYHD